MLAFVFPGQGAQAVGMGRELAARFPVARAAFDEADAALGVALSRLCFEGPEAELQRTANSQPAILTTSIAALRVLEAETGLTPTAVAGHSLGEYTALVCAGAIAFADAVRVVRQRGQFMQEAVPEGAGGMAAVMGLSREEVDAVCKAAAEGDVLAPANFNGAGQIVIAGSAAAIGRAAQLVDTKGGVARLLKVSAPFHCALMRPAAERLGEVLDAIALQDPKLPVVANVDAAPNTSGARLRELLVRQVDGAVQWERCVQRLAEMGVREVIEVGPGKTLVGLARRIDKKLVLSNFGVPEDLAALVAKAAGPLAGSVVRGHARAAAAEPTSTADVAQWGRANDGSRLSKDGRQIRWADGGSERVDDLEWSSVEGGLRLRRFGRMALIWPDGRLEVLEPAQWRRREDGAMLRRDGTRVISANGEVEDFDVSQWAMDEGGTMRMLDGSRIIWSDGLEWRFDDAEAHGV